jgi:hypothetical protein
MPWIMDWNGEGYEWGWGDLKSLFFFVNLTDGWDLRKPTGLSVNIKEVKERIFFYNLIDRQVSVLCTIIINHFKVNKI